MKKIYLLEQESNVDGEILFNVVPCSTFEKAREEMNKEIKTLLSECKQYQGAVDVKKVTFIGENTSNTNIDCVEGFTVEKTDNSFYIACDYDDYSEYLEIIEKDVL